MRLRTVEKKYIAGLDIGQVQDYTALAVLEVTPGAGGLAAYHCRHLQRFPLGMPYPAMVSEVARLLATPELSRRCQLVIDNTGVGRPITDLVRNAGLRCVAITIHGGDNVTRVSNLEYKVPKRDLVAAVQVLLQTERLKFAAAMPEVSTLVHELQNFRYKISATGHDTYDAWRESDHDDLVLAVAMACWWGDCAPIVTREVRSLR